MYFSFPAYETLTDDNRRKEYDQMRSSPFSGESPRGGGDHFHQHFSFNFNDIFRDSDKFGHNPHLHNKKHFERHFQAHEEARSRHRRHFQHSFGGDIFEDMERMFSFNGHQTRTQSQFHSSTRQHCRTVTQRRGNMVTTYTDCSWVNAHMEMSLGVLTKTVINSVLLFCVFGSVLMTSIKSSARIAYFWA